MDILANERQKKIIAMVSENNAVTTSELVEKFGVSIETVRRDLLCLETRHKLQRVHGGAVSVGEMKQFHTLSYRTEENTDRKRELGKTASLLVNNGDTIAIDAGSTAIEFAQALKQRLDTLTVVTHSLDVFDLLCRHRNFHVILCAGSFLPSENTFCGQFVLDQYKKIHVEKSFIFPYAVSLKYGIYDHQQELYSVQKLMTEISDEVFVLADSSKFEKSALLKISDMKTDYTYVADSALPEKLCKLYRENGINIITGKGDLK